MKKPQFRSKLNVNQIREYAKKYPASEDREIIRKMAHTVRRRGSLKKNELYKVCLWKSARSAGKSLKNDPKYVVEVTRNAFASPNERFRIESLTILDGVGWPTASVLLHFFARDRYPILDVRALWSLGIEGSISYNFPFWNAYTITCQKLATKAAVDMRTLDRALWYYSRENQ